MTHFSSAKETPRARLRELGIRVGRLEPGAFNAITDVPGVEVGAVTLLRDAPRTVRTGVTAIWPGGRDVWTRPVFAGIHSFNGNGEMTGALWIAEQGLLTTPIAITNTHSIGLARDALGAYGNAKGADSPWMLPVAAETHDGLLNDAWSMALTFEHVFAALDGATGGAVAEGNVGGGTGMIAHEFKGGTGTASRLVTEGGARYVVGALVQANYGMRELLRVDGVPVGEAIGIDVVPSPRRPRADTGSIIAVLATDAPLLPIQCQRLARRATTGLAWVGGIGANSSGDIFIAFSTANRVDPRAAVGTVSMISPDGMTALFRAAAEATEEAILNALCKAETMTGFQDRTAYALPLERLQETMRAWKRI
ncbi:MAG TPA: P1 family peptidase [Stellaceae bacterium]|nr:P1 family peptidase [Stellaceae bacterium]